MSEPWISMTPTEAILVAAAVALAVVAALMLLSGGQASEGNVLLDRDQKRTQALIQSEFTNLRYVQERATEELIAVASRRLLAQQGPAPSGQSLELIRGLSHSLGTPLAGIIADLTVIEKKLSGEIDRGLKKNLTRIRTAVDLSQAFLLAYRHLGVVEDHTGFLAEADLAAIVQRAAEFYTSQIRPSVRTEVSIPDKLPPYENYQLLAVLLPLIENATEGTSDDLISIEHLIEGNGSAIVVTNAINQAPPREFASDGVTGKDPAHHKGLGLGVSAQLARSQKWSLSHQVTEDKFAVTVHLARQ